MSQTLGERLARVRRVLSDLAFGVTGYEFAHYSMRMRADMETLFLLVTLGDLVGLPVLPPYYTLRLLPHVVPQIQTWKRSVLREKELWEREEYDLIEM